MAKYTNQSIRKLLGERGFIQDPTVANHERYTVSFWARGTLRIRLVEYNDGSPIITLKDSLEEVNPEDLGYRNLNIQNDGSPDE